MVVNSNSKQMRWIIALYRWYILFLGKTIALKWEFHYVTELINESFLFTIKEAITYIVKTNQPILFYTRNNTSYYHTPWFSLWKITPLIANGWTWIYIRCQKKIKHFSQTPCTLYYPFNAIFQWRWREKEAKFQDGFKHGDTTSSHH